MALYVHSLKIVEGKKIQSLLRHSKNRVVVRRAQVVLLSEQGMQAKEIARATLMHEGYVRELIRRFNREGMELFVVRKQSGPTSRVFRGNQGRDC
jgi:transposase